jgi:hypothetical protein
MGRMRAVLPLLALLLAAQEPAPGEARGADALYPCRASANVVRFFHVEEDAPDLAKVRPALAELGAELLHGPRTTSGRPGHAFVAVRAPRAVAPKKLAAALRKGGGAADELAALVFDGRTGEAHDFGLGGLGVTKRDFVMGMSGDVTWYEMAGERSQLFGPPGKLDAAELAARYAKLYEPYGGSKLGAPARERFTWTLAKAPDEKLRAKLERALGKLDGVTEIALAGAELTVTVTLADLAACGDVGPIPADAEVLDDASRGAPRVAFDTGPLYEQLRAEGLVP